MHKRIAVISVALLFAVGAYGEGIGWFMDAGWAFYGDGTTWLNGDLSSSIGCFVQLLWVGPNGAPDPAWNYGDGTIYTDDVVVDKRWIGAGAAGGDDGWFAGGEVWAGGNIVSGRVYFARFWSDASPNYALGLVPTSPTNRYANGPLWTYPHKDPIVDDFDVVYEGDISTTLSPMVIPEPGVLALVALGLMGLRFTRKRS